MSDADTSGSDASAIDQQPTTDSTESQLSVDFSQSSITSSVTNVALEAISKKAKELLNKKDSVLRAPGSNEAFVVESQTLTKPHYVTI